MMTMGQSKDFIKGRIVLIKKGCVRSVNLTVISMRQFFIFFVMYAIKAALHRHGGGQLLNS